MPEKLKILVAHSVRELRDGLARALAANDDMAVVGVAPSGVAALGVAENKNIDILLLDVELPDYLDALREFLRRNLEQPEQPDIGALLIASRDPRYADRTIRGLEAGAFDFVRPPQVATAAEDIVHVLMRQLLVKLRYFSSKRIFSSLGASLGMAAAPRPGLARSLVANSRFKAVVIGVSTGGPKTLASLVPQLSEALDLPIFIVQHMPPEFTASLATSLDSKCTHRVSEARHNDPVESRRIYIAPGGRHLVVRRNADRSASLALTDDPPEEGCRPSANLLFASAAKIYGQALVGILLTGMGMDGTRGAKELKKIGACVIAQDKASSVVWGMPGSAVASGCVDKILHPDEMAAFIAAPA